MRFQQVRPGTYVLPLSVTFVIPYVGLCAIWFLWILCTARSSEIGSNEALRLITAAQFLGVTAANVLLLFFLFADGQRARENPPGLRASHFVGVALGVAALFAIQLGVITFYAPALSR